jgi:hypothetical protein
MLLRRPLPAALAAASLAAAAALAAVAAPPISALPIPATLPADVCAVSSTQGQGRTAGDATEACVGAGLSFTGPSTDVFTVIGPTIISPAVVGTTIVAGGNVAIAP